MVTSVLHMEWLGDEHVMQKVGDSSAGGHEALVFHAKNCVTCGYPVGSLLAYKKCLFLIHFFRFSGNQITAASKTGTDEPPHHCQYDCAGSKNHH